MDIPAEVLVAAQRERIAALNEEIARLADENVQLRAAFDFYRGVVEGLAEQAREHAQEHEEGTHTHGGVAVVDPGTGGEQD